MIPLLDLKKLNAAVQAEIEAAMLRVARSGRYILGLEVESFEAAWASYCGTKHCVGVGNALEALMLILKGYGVGPGDEVLVPANTYIATWLAVTHVGATPVPVEPHPVTMNMDPAAALAAVTVRTKAVIAVHLYGCPAPMWELGEVCNRHGLWLIEDAAQAHGALLVGASGPRRAGNFADAAAFSFYPSKNLGALGDAGAVTTNDTGLASRVRRLRSYGGSDQVGKLDHKLQGMNSRLDELQAAVLLAKLPHLDTWNARRRQRAAFYDGALCDPLINLPPLMPGHVFHQYVIQIEERDAVVKLLRQAGVDTHVHYPVPPHLELAYKDYRRCVLPITERLAGRILSLPIGNDGLDVAAVARAVRAAVTLREIA